MIHLQSLIVAIIILFPLLCLGDAEYVTQEQLANAVADVEAAYYVQGPRSTEQDIHDALSSTSIPYELRRANKRIDETNRKIGDVEKTIDRRFSSLEQNITNVSDRLFNTVEKFLKQLSENNVLMNRLDLRVSVLEGQKKSSDEHWQTGKREITVGIIVGATIIVLTWLFQLSCKNKRLLVRLLRLIRKNKKV